MRIRNFISVLLLTLILSVLVQNGANAQEPFKIVFINHYAFLDRDKGINAYISADKFCAETCRFANSRIYKLADELRDNNLSSELRAEKEAELDKLVTEDREFWKRRQKICIAPVLEEIARAQGELEKEKNLVILDLAELIENGQILALDEKTDITAEFAKYFNNRKNPDNSFTAEITDNKIAVINTNILIENNVGVGCLAKQDSDEKPDVEDCRKIWKDLQDFAFAKGFNIVFNSGKPLPERIQNFAKTDLTEDFILNYNRTK